MHVIILIREEICGFVVSGLFEIDNKLSSLWDALVSSGQLLCMRAHEQCHLVNYVSRGRYLLPVIKHVHYHTWLVSVYLKSWPAYVCALYIYIYSGMYKHLTAKHLIFQPQTTPATPAKQIASINCIDKAGCVHVALMLHSGPTCIYKDVWKHMIMQVGEAGSSGFLHHITNDHNMWKYLFFQVYLRERSYSEYSGTPLYITIC